MPCRSHFTFSLVNWSMTGPALVRPGSRAASFVIGAGLLAFVAGTYWKTVSNVSSDDLEKELVRSGASPPVATATASDGSQLPPPRAPIAHQTCLAAHKLPCHAWMLWQERELAEEERRQARAAAKAQQPQQQAAH